MSCCCIDAQHIVRVCFCTLSLSRAACFLLQSRGLGTEKQLHTPRTFRNVWFKPNNNKVVIRVRSSWICLSNWSRLWNVPKIVFLLRQMSVSIKQILSIPVIPPAPALKHKIKIRMNLLEQQMCLCTRLFPLTCLPFLSPSPYIVSQFQKHKLLDGTDQSIHTRDNSAEPSVCFLDSQGGRKGGYDDMMYIMSVIYTLLLNVEQTIKLKVLLEWPKHI